MTPGAITANDVRNRILTKQSRMAPASIDILKASVNPSAWLAPAWSTTHFARRQTRHASRLTGSRGADASSTRANATFDDW